MQDNATEKTQRRGARTASITGDAATLGIHRTTLWRILQGRSSSPEIFGRYNSLIRLRSKTTNP